jgi:hypothetical protein
VIHISPYSLQLWKFVTCVTPVNLGVMVRCLLQAI